MKQKKELSLFSQFAKGIQAQQVVNNNCVIYTRVSTKEQADNNMSLATQRKVCEQYAARVGMQINGYFGGTYESAKTDERQEFNKMLNFVNKSKEKIGYIIVYRVDRFSRSGTNAMYIADQLKKKGIVVYAVTQPTDASTVSGRLQQNIQFIFSEYDNQLRRKKCMDGIKDKLLEGVWCARAPMGYDVIKRGDKKEYQINKVGKLIGKAFHWKGEGASNEEVLARLASHGVQLTKQRISCILRNPFYCGLIVHNALEGRVIEGCQEKIVSQELFLKVNGILAKHHQGYTVTSENDIIPLKRFLKCDECGSYLRGYKAYKNQKYYYKCNTPGCRCNKRADILHEWFKGIISTLTIDINDDYRHLIKLQMIATYNQLTEADREKETTLQNQLKELDKKIHRLRERYAIEEIDKEMYEEFGTKFLNERNEIAKQLAELENNVSNPEKSADAAIDYASNLATAWDLGGYKEKQQIQSMLFPEGMSYNRKNDECRTPRINEVFLQIAEQAHELTKNKNGNNTFVSLPSFFVPRTGVEPVIPP